MPFFNTFGGGSIRGFGGTVASGGGGVPITILSGSHTDDGSTITFGPAVGKTAPSPSAVTGSFRIDDISRITSIQLKGAAGVKGSYAENRTLGGDLTFNISSHATSSSNLEGYTVHWGIEGGGDSWADGGACAWVGPFKGCSHMSTTLNGAINNSVTSFNLTSVTGLPSSGGTVLIGSEEITYTGISSYAITGCTRGANGTTAAAHSNGATVLGNKLWAVASGGGASGSDNYGAPSDAATNGASYSASNLYTSPIAPGAPPGMSAAGSGTPTAAGSSTYCNPTYYGPCAGWLTGAALTANWGGGGGGGGAYGGGNGNDTCGSNGGGGGAGCSLRNNTYFNGETVGTGNTANTAVIYINYS